MQFHIMFFLTKPTIGEDLVVKHLNFRWRDRCLCRYLSMSKLNSSSSDGDNILGGDTQAVCCSSAGEVVAA